ncbi:hypothetical protein HK101_003829 [Irineochytrium annulatum]|nr:hypothetical protein HK101_003829 [Irineochytrium annulatum]
MDDSTLPTAAELRQGAVEAATEAAVDEDAPNEVAKEAVDDSHDDFSAGVSSPILASTPPKHDLAEEEPPQPMQPAESKPKPSEWGTWSFANTFSWGSIVDTSEIVADVYKRDISEFVSVVAANSVDSVGKITSTVNSVARGVILGEEDDGEVVDAEDARGESDEQGGGPGDAMSPIANAVAKFEELADRAEGMLDKFGTGLTTFLSNAVHIAPPESGPARASQRKIIYDRKSAAVAAVRKDTSTFLRDPLTLITSAVPSERDSAERFMVYRLGFNLSEHSATIARVLDDDSDFDKLLQRIVPSQVTAEDFWLRYFYRVSEVEREEETRKRLMMESNLNDEEVAWESDEDEATTAAEVPEVEAVEAPPPAASEETLTAPVPTPLPKPAGVLLVRRDGDSSDGGYEIVSRPGSAQGAATPAAEKSESSLSPVEVAPIRPSEEKRAPAAEGEGEGWGEDWE